MSGPQQSIRLLAGGDGQDVAQLREIVDATTVHPDIATYVVKIIRATRPCLQLNSERRREPLYIFSPRRRRSLDCRDAST